MTTKFKLLMDFSRSVPSVFCVDFVHHENLFLLQPLELVHLISTLLQLQNKLFLFDEWVHILAAFQHLEAFGYEVGDIISPVLIC